MKNCNSCFQNKDFSRFNRHPYTSDKYQPWCKDCLRDRNNSRNIHIDFSIIERARREHSGLCDLCRLPERAVVKKGRRETRALALDHNHETGEIRGFLCMNCNTLLGKARDRPEILRRAIAYLERASARARTRGR